MGAIVAVAVVAPMAQGTGRVDRVAALERNVKALQARVGALESQAAAAKNDAATAKSDLAAVQASVSTLQSGASTAQASVSALQSSVSALESSVGTLTTCLRYKVLPLSQYDGYLYTPDGNHIMFTTAIDVTEHGQSAGAYAAVVNPSCVGASVVMRIASQTQRLVDTIHSR